MVSLYGLIWDFSQHGSHGEVGQSLSAAYTSKAIVPVNQTQVCIAIYDIASEHLSSSLSHSLGYKRVID